MWEAVRKPKSEEVRTGMLVVRGEFSKQSYTPGSVKLGRVGFREGKEENN